MPAHRAVILPGTGSDEVFVRRAFGAALGRWGISLLAPRPEPGAALITTALRELDAAAAGGPVLAGGVSLGGHLAAQWALANPDRCAGLLIAMPGWLGPPGDAPAAVAARIGAERIERDGLAAALSAATDGVPGWLAAELQRAWTRQGPALAAGMRAAATHPAPDAGQLRGLRTPAAVVACRDDPLHPEGVARRWAAALPVAGLTTITLVELGAEPAALGRAAVRTWPGLDP